MLIFVQAMGVCFCSVVGFWWKMAPSCRIVDITLLSFCKRTTFVTYTQGDR